MTRPAGGAGFRQYQWQRHANGHRKQLLGGRRAQEPQLPVGTGSGTYIASYSYDVMGRLLNVRNGHTDLVTALAYNGQGQTTRTTYSNGVTTRRLLCLLTADWLIVHLRLIAGNLSNKIRG